MLDVARADQPLCEPLSGSFDIGRQCGRSGLWRQVVGLHPGVQALLRVRPAQQAHGQSCMGRLKAGLHRRGRRHQFAGVHVANTVVPCTLR
eukprot:TRINITY_DN10288_c0_g1_i2.p2 TRINITY_DN10288_c0_g1~~TRINITY_DN10288_c0_g1_i2.p2  ORF type:complete len:101 (-),score=3.70 TRINITY_DN10288_c0_g1_i2:5-277(-)